MALVNPNVKDSGPAQTAPVGSSPHAPQGKDATLQQDPDLYRAQELVSLHQNIKARYSNSGLDAELLDSRKNVKQVLAALNE